MLLMPTRPHSNEAKTFPSVARGDPLQATGTSTVVVLGGVYPAIDFVFLATSILSQPIQRSDKRPSVDESSAAGAP